MTFIEDKNKEYGLETYQWLSLCIGNLGVSIKEFWDMPFFMVVDLLKRQSTTKEESKTRKEVLASMRSNKLKHGWV